MAYVQSEFKIYFTILWNQTALYKMHIDKDVGNCAIIFYLKKKRGGGEKKKNVLQRKAGLFLAKEVQTEENFLIFLIMYCIPIPTREIIFKSQKSKKRHFIPPSIKNNSKGDAAI